MDTGVRESKHIETGCTKECGIKRMRKWNVSKPNTFEYYIVKKWYKAARSEWVRRQRGR